MRNIGKDRRQVLGIREKPDHIDMAIGDEVEPAARETIYAADPQARNATELTDARRSRAWHPRDRAERCNGSIEESFAEAVAALPAIEAGTCDEIGLSQWPQ